MTPEERVAEVDQAYVHTMRFRPPMHPDTCTKLYLSMMADAVRAAVEEEREAARQAFMVKVDAYTAGFEAGKAEEREACAKLADADPVAYVTAKAIRARGDK